MYKKYSIELKRIGEVLARKYKPEKVIVFGSYASNKIHKWSDLDIVVVKNTKKRFADRIEEVIGLVKPKEATDFLVYTPSEFAEMAKNNYFIRDEVLKKGQVIYG